MKLKLGSDNDIIAFIKAVDKEYFDRFVNDGQVCLNTTKWFREYERNDPNIGDAYEGVIIACGKGITLSSANSIESYTSVEDLKNKIDEASWSESISGITDLKIYSSDYNANIFSLYAITSSLYDTCQVEEHILPDKFISEFSNHRFVLIVNPSIFISKMKDGMAKIGKSMKYGMVAYYKLDENLKDNLSPFDKQDRYLYQKEFRLISEGKNAVKQVINIGSLNEICFEIDPTKFMYRIKNDEVDLIIRPEN